MQVCFGSVGLEHQDTSVTLALPCHHSGNVDAEADGYDFDNCSGFFRRFSVRHHFLRFVAHQACHALGVFPA
jgi:hypothetical protein